MKCSMDATKVLIFNRFVVQVLRPRASKLGLGRSESVTHELLPVVTINDNLRIFSKELLTSMALNMQQEISSLSWTPICPIM